MKLSEGKKLSDKAGKSLGKWERRRFISFKLTPVSIIVRHKFYAIERKTDDDDDDKTKERKKSTIATNNVNL